MKIAYYCQGLTLTPSRPGSTYYLDGVQSVGSDYDLASTEVKDTGRSQSTRIYLPTNNSLTVDRIISNFTDETTRITGPLLHYIFSANSLYSAATGPTTYKLGYFPKLHGLSLTGTSSDILQYDLELIYQEESTILDASRAISSLKFMNSLLTGISYSISTLGYLREGTTFTGRNIEIGSGAYTKSPITTGEFNDGKFIKTIRAHHFDTTNSVFPSELLEVIDNNTFVDGQEVLGLTEISADLGVEYSRQGDQGKWLGSTTSSETNLWAVAQIPFPISCSFTFTARKSIDTAIKNRQDNFTNQPIRLVFKCHNHDGSPGNYFVINLGTKNYLESISITGGSTDGSLVEYIYKYVNSNNDFLTYFTNTGNFTAVDQSATEKY